jgi:error-prone DNA polymerase
MNAGNFGALPAYAELQVASDFSFLHGASRAEEYVARAAQLGYSAIAITDSARWLASCARTSKRRPRTCR